MTSPAHTSAAGSDTHRGASMYEDGTYLSHQPDWHDDDGAWKAAQIAAMLSRHNLVPGSVLDVGCGTGRVLEELAGGLPPATRLVGYDMAEAAVALGRARGSRRIELRAGDALATDETYDLLLMIDVFEHVPDYLGFLAAVRDRARRFVFHIPLDMNVLAISRMSPITSARRRIGHLHYFSRETALATLVDAGYRIVDEAYTAGGVELVRARSPRRTAAKLPRRLMYSVRPHLAARLLGGFSLLVLCEPAGTARPNA